MTTQQKLTVFQYKARDASGKMVTGSTQAPDMSLVAETLRQNGLIPISIVPKSVLAQEIRLPGLGNRIKLADLAVMSRQFAAMIDSGITVVRALDVLAAQTESPALAAVLEDVKARVEQGSALSAAMAEHPNAFNALYVAMVKAGEAGGTLDQVLNKIASTLERQVELRRTIRSASVYPLAVLCFAMLIVLAVLIFIVPVFKRLFAQLHSKLPAPTLVIVKISQILSSVYVIPVIAAIVLIVYGLYRYVHTERGRQVWDTLKLKIPIVGKTIHKAALARFTNTLSSLVSSGVPLIDALEISADTANNTVVGDAIKDAREGVREGLSLSLKLQEHTVIPPMVVQMIDTGEQTGALDTMLQKIADFYDSEVKAAVDSLTSVLEPVLIAILGAIVGSIVISLYLPMFYYIKAVQNIQT